MQFVEILNPSEMTWLGVTRRKLEPAEGNWKILITLGLSLEADAVLPQTSQVQMSGRWLLRAQLRVGP